MSTRFSEPPFEFAGLLETKLCCFNSSFEVLFSMMKLVWGWFHSPFEVRSVDFVRVRGYFDLFLYSVFSWVSRSILAQRCCNLHLSLLCFYQICCWNSCYLPVKARDLFSCHFVLLPSGTASWLNKINLQICFGNKNCWKLFLPHLFCLYLCLMAILGLFNYWSVN